jgi:hypothetical protein
MSLAEIREVLATIRKVLRVQPLTEESHALVVHSQGVGKAVA